MENNKVKKVFKSIYFSFIWLMVVIFAIDLITKWVIQVNVNEGEKIQLIKNFLYISKSYNLGMAWSIGAMGGIPSRVLFISVSAIIGTGLLVYYIKKAKTLSSWYRVALALMIAGAYGNLIDRAFYWNSIVGFEGVIDWIDVYIFGYDFPMFNIADSSLVVGVAILIVLMVVDIIKENKEKAKRGEFKYSPEQLAKMNEEYNKKDEPIEVGEIDTTKEENK